jgi:arginase
MKPAGKKIIIVEFPSNLGLIEPAPGKEPGVRKLPAWLKQFHFYDLLKPEKIFLLNPPAYSMRVDPVSGVRNADAIVSFAIEQAGLLKEVIDEKIFPVVIGGDCSIIIGNTLALKEMGEYGLFFLDGHTDFMWPELSGTKGAAGMDLAIVTGHAHNKLSDIRNQRPYIKEENTWCVGNREFDKNYTDTIENSNIKYFDINKMRLHGMEACCRSFLKMVAENKLDGFWIHLDLDVLDDEIMPAVDSRSAGGISYNELKSALTYLIASDKARGIEITILDPDLDPDGFFTSLFVKEIGQLLRDLV